jgi:hypothetical protein
MSKKKYKHRERHMRARKGPPPRPARKPGPANAWQRLRANRPAFYGAVALVVVLLVGMIFGGSLLVRQQPKPTPVPSLTPVPSPTVAPSPTALGMPWWPAPLAMKVGRSGWPA